MAQSNEVQKVTVTLLRKPSSADSKQRTIYEKSIGLSREVSQTEKSVVTTNCEKSAEAIVPREKTWEGLNNSKRQFEMYVPSNNPDYV